MKTPEYKEKQLNPVFEKIAIILKYSEDQKQLLLIEEEKKGAKKTIADILKANNDNKELKILGIKEGFVNFYSLEAVQKNDLDIAKEAIKSLIREGESVLGVQAFLKKYYKKTDLYLILETFYNDFLGRESRIFRDDLSKSLSVIEKSEPDFFNILISKKIITSNQNNIFINNDYSKGLTNKILKNKDFLETDQKEDFIFAYICKQIGVIHGNMTDDIRMFLNSYVGVIINSQKQTELQKKKTETQNEKQEKIDEGIEDEPYDTDDEVTENFLEEKFDYCIPSCSYYVSDNNYILESQGNRRISISKNEAERFSSVALKNYVSFINMMYDLGLQFLWNNHKAGFQTILNSSFAFDYVSGEGMTESKQLSVLNVIGKNIGVKQKSVLITGADGKSENKVVCFDTLGGAKMEFSSIKSTGKINGETYSDLGMNSLGTVESYLRSNSKMEISGKELYISNWK